MQAIASQAVVSAVILLRLAIVVMPGMLLDEGNKRGRVVKPFATNVLAQKARMQVTLQRETPADESEQHEILVVADLERHDTVVDCELVARVPDLHRA